MLVAILKVILVFGVQFIYFVAAHTDRDDAVASYANKSLKFAGMAMYRK